MLRKQIYFSFYYAYYPLFFKTVDERRVEPFVALQERSRVCWLRRISRDALALNPVRASFIACLFFTTCIGNVCEELSESWWVEIQALSVDERTAIAQAGVCIEEINDDWIAGVADLESIQQLASNGFTIQKALPISQHYQEDLAEFLLKRSSYRYNSYSDMVTTLSLLTEENPEIATLYSIGESCEDRDLLMLQLSNTQSMTEDQEKAGILFVGNLHAREHLGAEICLQLALHLCNHKDNPSVAHLFDTTAIYILPMANPDGAMYDFSKNPFAQWRKNRHVYNNRFIGVDLNRNFNYWWSAGQSTRPSSETYGGPNPFSEPETISLQSFIETHKNITIVLFYHSYGKLVLYPWGCKHQPIENPRDAQVFVTLAHTMAQRMGYHARQSSSLYLAPGDAADWAYGVNNLFAFEIEVMPSGAHEGGFYPVNTSAIDDDIEKNIQAALYLCQLADNPYQVLDPVKQ